MKAAHDFLIGTNLPWDVCILIKEFLAGSVIKDDVEPDYTEMSARDLIKFRARHKGRAFTW